MDLTAEQKHMRGRARRYGTTHARQDRDEDRTYGQRQWTKAGVIANVVGPVRADADPDFATLVFESYTASYVTKWQLIGVCDHELKQKGERAFGTSDGARCIHCGVSVLHGSTLDIPDLTQKD